MTNPAHLGNEPADFDRFVGAPHHRLLAIFDDAAAAGEAVQVLRFEGYADGEDLWILSGEEGARRLDITGRAHGIWARGFRTLQKLMSNDFGYPQSLDQALRDGSTVVGVWVPSEEEADEVARRLRLCGGRDIAYGAHLDFVPVAA